MRFRFSVSDFTRFASTVALLLGSGISFAVPSGTSAAEPPPNIIFIMADDLGYGDLGCFGSTKIHTPHLDRLASEGTRFTATYEGSPVCAPSRGVLLKGLHTGHGLIRDNNPTVGGELEPFDGGREGGIRLSFRASDRTVAELLKIAGYATGVAGKCGVGEAGSAGTPLQHGFDEWLGYLNQNHAPYYYTDYLDENDGRREIPENAGGKRVVYGNDLMSDFAVDFVQRHRNRPFFLYLPYTIPHNLMEVPELGEYAARDWAEDARIYAAGVTRLDGYVGRLMGELDRLGLADRTLVIFTSDNGPLEGARCELLGSACGLRGFKSSLYEGGIRVPTIARWPDRAAAGRTSVEPWMFADLLPTWSELAGVATSAGLDGRSVLPVLTGQVETLGERALYWEFPRDRLHQAVRFGRWKAVRFGLDQPAELYGLTTDPGETRNVAPLHPDIVARLSRILDSSHEPSPHWPVN